MNSTGDLLAVIPDSREVVEVWDLDSCNLVSRRNDQVFAKVSVSKQDQLLALTTSNELVLQELRTGEHLIRFELPRGFVVSSQAFSNGGEQVLVGDQHGHVAVFDLDDPRPLRHSNLGEDEIVAVALSPDNQLFLTLSREGSLRISDSQTGATKASYELGESPQSYRSIQFSPHDESMVAIVSGGTWILNLALPGRSIFLATGGLLRGGSLGELFRSGDDLQS